MRNTCFEHLKNHMIICGWQEKTPQIIKELMASEEYGRTDIIVISDKEDFTCMDLNRIGIDRPCVYLIEGDFTDPAVLKKARIDVAKIAIILPDRSCKRSNRDIDARTVLTALTIEKLNSSVYSCVELLDPEYESHMAIGNVDQVIVGGYYSGLIAAQSAINEYIIPFLKSLLPSESENKLQNIPLPPELTGKEFGEAIKFFRKKEGTLIMGVRLFEGELILNPKNYFLKGGDYLLGIVNKDTRGEKE